MAGSNFLGRPVPTFGFKLSKPIVVPASERVAAWHGRQGLSVALGLSIGLGGQPSECLDIVNVLLPPWSAVAQVRELLLHGEHA